MSQYKIIFKRGGKSMPKVIEARNYDDSFVVADKIALQFKRKTGLSLQVHTSERLYGAPQKKRKGTRNEGENVGANISTGIEVLAGIFG